MLTVGSLTILIANMNRVFGTVSMRIAIGAIIMQKCNNVKRYILTTVLITMTVISITINIIRVVIVIVNFIIIVVR